MPRVQPFPRVLEKGPHYQGHKGNCLGFIVSITKTREFPTRGERRRLVVAGAVALSVPPPPPPSRG